MNVSVYLFLSALLIITKISDSEGVRGFYHNVQVSSGSALNLPDFLRSSQKKEIPLDMLLRMNEALDTKDFIENFVYSETDNVTLTEISSRIGHEEVERSTGLTKAKMAICMPELKTVPVIPGDNTIFFYRPSCIRVERCGGCCAHSLLTCTPVESEIMNVPVVVTEYKGGQKLVLRDFTVVPVERHTKCKCDCRIQPKDCTKSQVYNKRKCNCECGNPDAEIKCNAENDYKLWNRDLCACTCREELECQTGYYFNSDTCKCEVQQGRIKSIKTPWTA